MINAEALYQAEPRRGTPLMWAGLLAVGGAFLGAEVVRGGPMIRVIVAILAMVVLGIPAIERPRGAVIGLFVLLPFMGAIRHLFIGSSGVAPLDPLLLVTSAVAITIFVSLTLNNEMDFGGTVLSKLVFLLLAIGLLQVFNPGQGNLLVGFTGIMINLIPISFFFIARSIADLEFTQKITRIVLVIGVMAAAYGLVQVFVGFRGFERDFIAHGASTSLTVGNTVRPFSFYNNAAEYAAYIHYAFVFAFAGLLFAPKKKRLLMLAVTSVIAYSGFLIGSRGFTVKVGLAIIILLAARAKHRLAATAIIFVLAGGAVLWSAATTSTGTIQEKQAGAAQLVEQQVRALKDPFNRNVSTLPVHFEAATTGIWYAITRQPAGLGTGVTTRGGAKFGGIQAGTELDIGDAFLSLGVAGGLLYMAIILVAVTQASRVRRALPGPVWIGIWVMAATSIGAWMTGGNYSITPLIWFMLGAADGAFKRMRDRGLMSGALEPR